MAFDGILSQIKLLFGLQVIQLVWYILKQLFTSVSVKVMANYPAASRLGISTIIHLHFGEDLITILCLFLCLIDLVKD